MAEEIPHSLNPLALSQSWGQDEHDDIHTAPLIALEKVLETSSLRRGISREQLLSELLRDLDHRRVIPLIGMLPRGWRMAPAVLPERLRGIATLLEDGLLSPLLLAALTDDLQHLLPIPENQPPSALEFWRQPSVALKPGHAVGVPCNLKNCRLLANQPITSDALSDPKQHGRTPLGKGLTALGSGLAWHNEGLVMLQNESSQRMNELMAQVLNCLAANRLPEALHPSEP
ncbi:MAG: ArgR family transcriptional regulator, partial [Cyanobacteriota bacterium]|nr:ArgR family transcriptional regulator [Cyanobacteriota bacterium]